jgi:EAL domain-containing protein (putative c-di-GMP-specific phosphodiesterase class I)
MHEVAGGVSVAVNFSPQQFHQRDVLSEVRYALEVSGLPATGSRSRSPNPRCCATPS